LSNIAKRFSRKEILQSIIYPSHIISAAHAPQTLVLTDGQQLTGIVVPGPEGEKIVLNADGEKVAVAEQDVSQQAPSKASTMPEGLLNELTLEQIADLFAFFQRPPNTAVTRRVEAD
jgi:putative heme-binding domain-containing protein